MSAQKKSQIIKDERVAPSTIEVFEQQFNKQQNLMKFL